MFMVTILMIHCMTYTRVLEFVDLRSHESNIQERLIWEGMAYRKDVSIWN